MNLFDEAAEIEVPVFRIVEIEERFNWDVNLKQRLDAEFNREADGQRPPPHVEIDHREERAFCRAFEFRQDRKQVCAHHQEQPRPRQFQQDDAFEIEDDTRPHGAKHGADAECPGVDLWTPSRDVGWVSLSDVLEPSKGGRHCGGRRLLARVVHREQAKEAIDAQARVSQRNCHRELNFQRNDHTCGLAAVLVDVRHTHAGRNADLHGNDGKVDLALDLALVHLQIATAAECAGNIDPCSERGQFRRSERVEPEAHACSFDSHHTEVDGEPKVDLENQRIVARNARAEDGEDLIQRRGDGDGAWARHIDRVAPRGVKDRTELELRLVRVVADSDADSLIADCQRRVAIDFQQRFAADGDIHAERSLHVEQDHRFGAGWAFAELHFAAVPDDAFAEHLHRAATSFG